MSDIKLPPLPPGSVARADELNPAINAMPFNEAMNYARQCVLADRAARAETVNTPKLSVWYGSMPESNGKHNYTAILKRARERLIDGAHFTIARSEYPDRVRYEADRMRFIIGEIGKEPDILAYDAELRSNAPTQERGADDDGG